MSIEEKKESESEKKQSQSNEEEHISEEEDSTKADKKTEGKESSGSNKDWRKFFFDEDNNPKPEGFLALLLAGFTAYYLMTY